VAINVDPDILLVDEVLAVGDEIFQRRCQEKFIALKDAGKTIVLVTHDLNAVTNLCDEAAWLENGQLEVVNSARRVVDQYMNSMQDEGPVSEHDPDGDRWGSGEARIEHAELRPTAPRSLDLAVARRSPSGSCTNSTNPSTVQCAGWRCTPSTGPI
jgi:ABC-2 type transport system ATP-binding protein